MIFRGLAYLSTVIHVRCLNFRVRNGNGCDTPAVAAIESQDPDLNRSVVDLQSTAWPLRHLGLAWDMFWRAERENFTRRLWISSGFEKPDLRRN